MDTTYNINGGFKPTVERFADLEGPDFSPKPAWATHALIDNEASGGTIWEPACGDGSMAEVLKLTGNPVVGSGLVDRGYGEVGQDFLCSWRGSAGLDDVASAAASRGRDLVLRGAETNHGRSSCRPANSFQRVGRERNGL